MAALAEPIRLHQPAETAIGWRDRLVGVSLTPDLDGYQTLCFLPPADATLLAAARFDLMRDLAWETIAALIGRPLAERRSEPIVLRLLEVDGSGTTLEIGASVAVVRNQVVFAAWVGSDGRVMLKLLPAGGMTAR